MHAIALTRVLLASCVLAVPLVAPTAAWAGDAPPRAGRIAFAGFRDER